VPHTEVVVSIDGAVHHPGNYELASTKDLTELLQLAGGLTDAVARSLPIRVVQKNARQQATAIELPFTGDATPNTTLHDQDSVSIRSAKDLQRTVLLIGAVTAADAVDDATTSARLPYIEGDTVLSLIDRAGGIKAPGDLRRSYISRPDQNGAIQMIPIDLDALLVRRDFKADKPIQMGDTIVVPPMRHSIMVEGAVVRAGLYTYNPSFGIPEYIALAGGRTHNARDLDEVSLVQPNGKTRSYRSGMTLNPGDAILVPERNFTRAEVVQITLAVAGLALTAITLGYAVMK
jgi:protein involved in polysaccharide export with SLBB domain